MKVHIVSVGGSHQPVLTSLRAQTPDRAIFFCSKKSKGTIDGPGKPCEIWKDGQCIEKQPSITVQAGLSEGSYDVWAVDDPDDLEECYNRVAEGLRGLLANDVQHEIGVDYTGGTKTMSVALAMAALDRGLKLMLTTGPRTDLVKVRNGQITERAGTSEIRLDRFLRDGLPRRLATFDYAAASDDINKVLSEVATGSERKKKLRVLITWTRALEAWDRFEHSESVELLEPHQRVQEVRNHLSVLKSVLASRAILESQSRSDQRPRDCHGYEALEDLVLNARRRRAQLCYDDAVGRLYRSLELLAQLRLRQSYDISTGGVKPEQVPEAFRPKLRVENGFAKLGLMDSFTLLHELNDQEVGGLFGERKGALQNSLQVRNFSILAHGFTPVNESTFREFSQVVEGLILEALGRITARGKSYILPRQLPSSVPEELSF